MGHVDNQSMTHTYHTDHLHLTMQRQMSDDITTREPEYTYEKLEKELHHKGNGSEMSKRKVGNNTWLIRDVDKIKVQLHNTDILVFYPDGRVTLNAATWTTQTTRDRLNAFLGWGTVEMERGDFYVNVNFRVSSVARSGHHYESTTQWVPARVHFENHMTLDVHTHEIVSHPDSRFTKIDESLVMREAADLSRVLGQATKYLIERLRSEAVTRDDIRHAVLLVNTYQNEHTRLLGQMRKLESAMDWASTTLEDTITAALTKHSDIQFERKGGLQKLFDPEQIEALLDELYQEL